MRRFAPLLLLVLVAASTAIAQDPGRPEPGRPEPRRHPEMREPQGMPVRTEPDPFGRFLFPPEWVMRHQGEINLQDAQRTTIQSAMQEAQSKVTDTQWKLAAEGEKLGRLLQAASVDETAALQQVDKILTLEREMKRSQMQLMVRIKNALTPTQQTKLRDLQEGPRPREEEQ